MDFIILANAAQTLLRRQLLEDNNDDFAGYGPTAPSASRPFMSKSADAELYLLATNFLLCEYT
jgi:hypothetical protein